MTLRLGIVVSLALLPLSGCDGGPTIPYGEVPLQMFGVEAVEIEPGDPIVVIGRPVTFQEFDPQPFLVEVSTGEQLVSAFNPPPPGRRSAWAPLSDLELASVITSRDGHVSIGFKEAGATQGTDDQGQSITSDETYESMKDWVQEQGVTIRFASEMIPAVSGELEDATEERVTTVRWHENVDYFEPDGLVILEAEDSPMILLQAGDLVAAILTSDDGSSGIRVRSGEEVTVSYQQPDRSIVRATVSVR